MVTDTVSSMPDNMHRASDLSTAEKISLFYEGGGDQGLAFDTAGRIVIALKDSEAFLRDHEKWTSKRAAALELEVEELLQVLGMPIYSLLLPLLK